MGENSILEDSSAGRPYNEEPPMQRLAFPGRGSGHCLFGGLDHLEAPFGFGPHGSRVFAEGAKGVEIEKFDSRLHARAGEDRYACFPVVMFIGVGVALCRPRP